MAVFRKLKGVNIKYGFPYPQKCFRMRNDVFGVFCEKKIRSGVYVVEPRKRIKTIHI